MHIIVRILSEMLRVTKLSLCTETFSLLLSQSNEKNELLFQLKQMGSSHMVGMMASKLLGKSKY